MQLKCHRKYLDIFNIDVICVGNNFMNLRYNSVMGIFVGKLLIFVGKLLIFVGKLLMKVVSLMLFAKILLIMKFSVVRDTN